MRGPDMDGPALGAGGGPAAGEPSLAQALAQAKEQLTKSVFNFR